MTTLDTPPDDRTTTAVSVRLCSPGQTPATVVSLAGRPDSSVIWVDVEPQTGPEDLSAALAALGIHLELDHVRDLLDRDELPKLEDHKGHRNVSAVGIAIPCETGGIDDLRFQMVEMLTGPGWLVTCWQHSRVCRGTGVDEDAGPVLKDRVLADVLTTWQDRGLTTAGDLATAHVDALTRRYKNAFRELDERLRAWEIEFHAGRVEDATGLKPLLGMVNECRRRLAALNNNRSAASNERWFDGLDLELDKRADHNLDRMLERLSFLCDSMRADLELVCMEELARQSRQAEIDSQQQQAFETKLGLVTAFLLVPTLIAGIFGANTWVPGQKSHPGFDAMIGLMVLTAPIVWYLIVWRGRSVS